MTNNENFFTESKIKLEEYIHERILLLKLQVLEKVSKIIAGLFSGLLMILFIFFILLFLSIMGGYFFADLTGSLVYGFGIIAGIYIVLFLILLAIKNKIIDVKITNFVIDIFFDKNEIKDESK